MQYFDCVTTSLAVMPTILGRVDMGSLTWAHIGLPKKGQAETSVHKS